MKVEQLKRLLQAAINDLSNYDDDAQIKTVTNTYFIESSYFIGTPDGFIDLREIGVDDEFMKIYDVAITASEDGENDSITFKRLDEIAYKHHVKLTLVSEHSEEGGWPTYDISGNGYDIYDFLNELGFDEDAIDEMLEECEE